MRPSTSILLATVISLSVGPLLGQGGGLSFETPLLPIGTVVAYAAEVGPRDSVIRQLLAAAGWLVCDGDEVPRQRFAKLYSAIGDIHGRGDGVSTFNLPDYRGRFLRGVDAAASRDPDAASRQPAAPGGLSGDRVGSVQEDAFSLHNHTTVQMVGDNNVDGVDSTTTHSGEHHNESLHTGSSGSAETRPKNANVHWLIFAGRSGS